MNFKTIKNLMVTKVYVDQNGRKRSCGDLEKSAGLCFRIADSRITGKASVVLN